MKGLATANNRSLDSDWGRIMLRRLILASERRPDGAASPSMRKLLGEASYALAPLTRRLGRSPVSHMTARRRSVLLLPGFLAPPLLMRYLGEQMARAGHLPEHWNQGFNFGPSEPQMEALQTQLLQMHRRAGDQIVIVGWSLGGLIARELAKRQPDAVAKVITMGSPFSGSRRANNAWRLYQLVTGHSVDAPPIEVDLAAKPPVETVALWSPRDGVVSPRSARGRPGERDRAIALRCTHMGFSYDPEALATILAELESD